MIAPKFISEAGYVGDDEALLVERVSYGLREAPKLWGAFRHRRLASVRIDVDGVECRLTKLETDDAIWRLHPGCQR